MKRVSKKLKRVYVCLDCLNHVGVINSCLIFQVISKTLKGARSHAQTYHHRVGVFDTKLKLIKILGWLF